jgi:hypothetical protein
MDEPTKTKAAPAPSLGPGPAHKHGAAGVAEPGQPGAAGVVYKSFQELAAALGVEQHREKTRKWVDVLPEGARK